MHQYKWDASDYAKSSSQQQQWARELIRKLALKGDERLLDIGCGDGKVTAEIAACLPRGSAVGIDSSKDMVALAQGTFPAELFPNLGFERQDASNLSFHDEFDVVFSNAALHWVLDHRPVLHGIYNSLRRGGKTLLQMGGQGNAADVITALDKLVASDEWHDYFVGFGLPYGFYSPDEYSEWLCAAGLRAIRIELIPKDMTHYGREGLEGWFRTTWLPYTQRVPEDKRTAFTDQLVNAYLKDHSPDDQGVVHVKMIRLEVEAVKDYGYMAQYTTLTSRLVPLPINNVDTDQIIPARFLKATDKDGMGDHLFADWRYNPDGSPKPDFVINRPEYRGAKILLAGDNFGCGSSREHAPWALTGYGFRAIISTSFADIFRNNALKNGLLPVIVDVQTHQMLFDLLAEIPHVQVTIDLATQTLAVPTGRSVSFPMDGFSKTCLLKGVDELGYLTSFDEQIAEYETRHD